MMRREAFNKNKKISNVTPSFTPRPVFREGRAFGVSAIDVGFRMVFHA